MPSPQERVFDGRDPEAYTDGGMLASEHMVKLLGGVANREVKLITAGVVTSQPNVWFSRSDIHKEVVQRQGPSPAWRVSRMLAANYCQHSLAPNDIVEVGTVDRPQGVSVAFRATGFGSQWGLAWSGGLMDWSLRYPDHSVQHLFAIPNAASEVGSPEARLRVLTSLMEVADGASYVDIANRIGRDVMHIDRVSGHLRVLRQLGVVEINSQLENYNPIFTITNPYPSDPHRAVTQALPVTRAAYRALAHLAESGQTTVSFEDLIQKALSIDDSLTYHEVRTQLTAAANPSNHRFPGLTVTDRNGTPVERNEVTVAADYKEPLKALLATLAKLQNPRALPKARARAIEIIDNPALCHQLMDKAHRFSAHRVSSKGGRKELLAHVTNILAAHGEVSLTSLQQALAEQGRPLLRDSVYKLLTDAANKGVVVVRRGQPSPSIRRTESMYSLPSAVEQKRPAISGEH